MPTAAAQLAAHGGLTVPEGGPVVVVEVFDDLERPSPVQDVAAYQLLFHLLGDVVTSCVTEFLDRLVQHQVGVTDQLMEVIQTSTGTFHRLEGLGQLAGRGDLFVRRLLRPRMVGGFGVCWSVMDCVYPIRQARTTATERESASVRLFPSAGSG